MKKKLNFEEGMQELEGLANKLETGELSLEDSFSAYERAVKLKKELEAILAQGEQKIRVLTENGETELDAEDVE